MEKPLISIIVPVYNVEQYLEKCLRCIINQTYKNIEIILVDDGSSDSSGDICDIWKERDKRIKVIHKENGGLSDARNRGIEEAKGAFLQFIDSDDIVENGMTEYLFELCKENDSQIAICDCVHFYVNENAKYQKGTHIKIFAAEDALCEMMYQKSFLFCAWGKLFKRELFDSIRFPVGMLFEDVAIMYKLFSIANTIVYSDAKLYGYLHRENSITTKKFDKRDCDILRICDDQVSFARKFSKKVYDAAVAYQVVGAFRVYLNAPSEEKFREDRSYSEDIIHEHGIEVFRNKYVRKKTRIAILLFFFNKRMLRMIYKHIDRWK